MAEATKSDHYNGLSLDAQSIVVVVTLAISLYNAIELFLLIFVTFKRYGGLYFWSLFIASLGVLSYSLGYMAVYFQMGRAYIGLIFNNIGWTLMVTGQSFVLFSRLHLVLSDRQILRAVLAMIIVDAIIFHIPTTILNFSANYDDHPVTAETGYKVYEKVQMTGFCIQEGESPFLSHKFIISGLYVWKTVKLLKVVSPDKNDARRTMWQLFSVNIIIIAMDIALLGIEYDNQRIYEQVLKGVIYSVKLKLEYAILGKLVQIVRKRDGTLSDALGDNDRNGSIVPDFIDRTKSTDDPRFAPDRSTSRPSRKGRRSRDAGVEHVEKVPVQYKETAEASDTRQRRKSESVLGPQRLNTGNRPLTIEEALTDASSIASEVPSQNNKSVDDEESVGDLYANVIRQMTRD